MSVREKSINTEWKESENSPINVCNKLETWVSYRNGAWCIAKRRKEKTMNKFMRQLSNPAQIKGREDWLRTKPGSDVIAFRVPIPVTVGGNRRIEFIDFFIDTRLYSSIHRRGGVQINLETIVHQ